MLTATAALDKQVYFKSSGGAASAHGLKMGRKTLDWECKHQIEDK